MKKKYLLIFLLFVLFSSCKQKSEKMQEIPSLHVMRVEESIVPTYIDMVGQATAVSTVQIVARVEGTLDKIEFVEGAYVRKGDVLYRIQQDQYENELLAAKAQMESAQASYDQAKTNLQRVSALVSSNAVSKTAYDQAVALEKETLASLHQTIANYKVAQLNYSYTTIYAPISGLITKTNITVGNLVSPSSGALAVITSVNPIYVQFDMNEGKYLQMISDSTLRSNMLSKKTPPIAVIVLPDGKKYTETGVLNYINPTVNSETGTIAMRAVFQNPEYLLRPGNFVTLRLIIGSENKGILLPQSVLIQVQSKYFVYVLDATNHIQQIEVTIAETDDNKVQILSGLKPGDTILSEGFQFVRNGMQVNPIY